MSTPQLGQMMLSTNAASGQASKLVSAVPSQQKARELQTLKGHFTKQEIQVMKRNLVSLRQKSNSTIGSMGSSSKQSNGNKNDENPY